MKKLILMAITLSTLALSVVAQTNTQLPSLPVKGELKIDYVTRQKPAGTRGIQDKYEINLNVANSVLFHGDMTDRPQIMEGLFTKTIVQGRSLKYDIECDVINPKNPTQTANVGRLAGFVPISSDGTYNYDKGTLSVDVLPRANAGGFSSKFTGRVQGKPLVRPPNWADTVRQTVNISRIVNGKPTVVALKRYDKMDFSSTVLAQGPVQIYQPVTVNGSLFYDYDKNCWFFKDFAVQYNDNGILKVDRVAGTIRWVKDKNRLRNGQGEYQFDIRVNEPIADAAASFGTGQSDESAFFTSDTSVPCLVGTMKYADRIQQDGTADGITLSSTVAIDLMGNNINKQQLMVLTKVIIFACVIPMNAD